MSAQVRECVSEQAELCPDRQSVSINRQQSSKRSRLYLQNSTAVSKKKQLMFEAR